MCVPLILYSCHGAFQRFISRAWLHAILHKRKPIYLALTMCQFEEERAPGAGDFQRGCCAMHTMYMYMYAHGFQNKLEN